MNLLLLNQSKSKMPKKYLKKVVNGLHRSLSRKGFSKQLKNKELVIVLVDRAQGQKLNNKFRKKNKATDVLSFSGVGHVLGELVLCAPVIKKQAKEHGLSFRDEAAYMVIHGCLHLLGFEHEKGGREAKKMYALQDELVDKILKI